MLSNKDRSYLNVARFAAQRSVARKTHGAVVVKGGRVLSMGYNKNRNHPSIMQPERIKSDCSYHAEQVAIREAGEDNVKGAVIYVARVKNGHDRESRPCPKCSALIERVGIKRVVFTTEAGEINYASN